MRSFNEWLPEAREELGSKPWLVLGKGPTFARRAEVDLDEYHLLGLNHVVSQQAVDVAHAIDLDVVEACADDLYDHCRYLLMPRVPHVRMVPSLRALEDFIPAVPVLACLVKEGRLVWYNAAPTPRSFPGSPQIKVRYFSSEAAFDVIGHLGGRTIRSVGIDGGVAYSGSFSHLDSKTRLANGQSSFDLQFLHLERIIRRWGIDYRPLFEPLRIFVGCSEDELLPAHVLAHSIREHASRPVSVIPMLGLEMPMPEKREHQPRTAFSFSRFAIPRLAGYHGRAVYFDSDMLVFGDVAELEDLPFEGASVLCTYQEAPAAWTDSKHFSPGRQYSVMVLDCDRLDWEIDRVVADLDSGRFTYEQLMFEFCLVPEPEIADRVPSEWNHLERFEAGSTRNLHYTIVPTQPWLSQENPLRDLWIEAYRRALTAGSVPPQLVENGIESGVLTPDLRDHLHLVPKREDLDPLVLELEATRARLRELEERRVRARVRRRAVRSVVPILEKLRLAAPGWAATQTVDRVARRVRRALS